MALVDCTHWGGWGGAPVSSGITGNGAGWASTRLLTATTLPLQRLHSLLLLQRMRSLVQSPIHCFGALGPGEALGLDQGGVQRHLVYPSSVPATGGNNHLG